MWIARVLVVGLALVPVPSLAALSLCPGLVASSQSSLRLEMPQSPAGKGFSLSTTPVLTADDSFLYLGFDHRQYGRWDLRTGKSDLIEPDAGGPLRSMAVSPKTGRYLALGF